MSEQQEEQAQKKHRRVEITERDLFVLRFIGEQYTARFDQIQRLLGSRAGAETQTPGLLNDGSTRSWLARMKALEAIEIEKPYQAQPRYVWLTGVGLRLAHLDFKVVRPSIMVLNHHYWCAQTRLYLAARRPDDVWIGERQLRSEQARATKNRQRRPELPDAHLSSQRGIIAIEVELGDKQAERLRGLVRRRAAEYYTVWYFCAREAQPRVEVAKKELPTEVRERVQIYSLSQLE